MLADPCRFTVRGSGIAEQPAPLLQAAQQLEEIVTLGQRVGRGRCGRS